MLPLSPIFLLFPAALFLAAHGVGDLHGFTFPGGGPGFEQADPCMMVFPPCMSEADRYSLEALQSIHQMMDDDQDGGIEVEESVEFIIEDMKQQQTHKHNHLHREDQHITVEELWRGWKSSEVHNWTQEDVLRWLKEFVELPQYERNFKDFKVTGNTLPRIAANEPSFLSMQLRVQDQRDKQKLNIKALDVVLFGPPTRPPHNYMKDLLLIVSVVMGVGGCWFAQVQNKTSKVHISKMMKDLESLQRAEQSLIDLQEQLERAQEEKRNVAEEKQNLEEKMRDEIMGAQVEAYRLHELRQGAVSELSRLRYAEEELEQVRGALKQAEKDMQASWTFSEALQLWLQLTHEVEVQYYNVKKQSAELQLATAKEEAERIKKKRSSLLGTLHVAHSSSLDQVDHKILTAKNALSEVTACLRERLHRWQQIELLCGFPVIRNPGLAKLTAQLYSDSVSLGLPRVPQASCSCHSSIHGSIEDLFEESAPPILPQMSVPPLKRSPRALGSTICRSRRTGVITQAPTSMLSTEPDLLIPIRAPYHGNENQEALFLKTLKKQDSQERFSDSECMAPPPHKQLFQSSTPDVTARKLYLDETELHGDAVVKSLNKEPEAVFESPVCKISFEDLEGSADIAYRKMAKDKVLDPSLVTSSSRMPMEDSVLDSTSRKFTRERNEVPSDVALRKGVAIELNPEFSLSNVEDTIGDTEDTVGDRLEAQLRNIYRDRSDLPMDVRKIIWNEVEASTDASRKISRDMLGASVDTASRKIKRDDNERPFDSRRLTRDSVGISQDAGSNKILWNPGDYRHDASVRVMVKDPLVEMARTPPRKISRDELECCLDTATVMKIPRERVEELIDASSLTEKHEYGFEPSAARMILRNEADVSSAAALKKRMPRLTKDDLDVYVENPTGKLSWDRTDDPVELQKALLRQEFGSYESGSLPGRIGQPDLMLTSQVPWRSSSDLISAGPLSQLVYDGILEKSCNPNNPSSTSLSASTPNLPQSKVPLEGEAPTPPPRAISSLAVTHTENTDEKNKEKSKKSMKIKNLFKKKETNPEKTQSGLQKL